MGTNWPDSWNRYGRSKYKRCHYAGTPANELHYFVHRSDKQPTADAGRLDNQGFRLERLLLMSASYEAEYFIEQLLSSCAWASYP